QLLALLGRQRGGEIGLARGAGGERGALVPAANGEPPAARCDRLAERQGGGARLGDAAEHEQACGSLAGEPVEQPDGGLDGGGGIEQRRADRTEAVIIARDENL